MTIATTDSYESSPSRSSRYTTLLPRPLGWLLDELRFRRDMRHILELEPRLLLDTGLDETDLRHALRRGHRRELKPQTPTPIPTIVPMTDIIRINKDAVARFLAGTQSANIDDLDVIDDTVVPHVVCHGFPGGELRDRESFKAYFRTFQQSFSGVCFENLATIATEEFVSNHWQIRATHAGEFQGITADQAYIAIDGAALYRMEGGLIAETWLTISEQLLASQPGKGRLSRDVA